MASAGVIARSLGGKYFYNDCEFIGQLIACIGSVVLALELLGMIDLAGNKLGAMFSES